MPISYQPPSSRHPTTVRTNEVYINKHAATTDIPIVIIDVCGRCHEDASLDVRDDPAAPVADTTATTEPIVALGTSPSAPFRDSE